LPPLGELLRRFRFLGVPGAPAAVGVPVDRHAVRAAELAPVLQALHDAEAEAAAIVARADHDAARRQERAAVRAHSIVAQASDQAGTVRAEATASRLTEARERSAQMVDEALREVADLDRRAAARSSVVVDELVSRVLATGSGPK
jgi:vacuolar-type H+-ATPase subunit H